MFAVLFEAHSRPDRRDAYAELARLLDGDLRENPGLVDHDLHRSVIRPGWMLSLSTWEDEKALVRWRTHPNHQLAQARGRNEIFVDYTVRTGELTRDTGTPDSGVLREQRFDETTAGAGNTVVLVGPMEPSCPPTTPDAGEIASRLGLDLEADGLTSWDVYEHVENPGMLLVRTVWRDQAAAADFESAAVFPGNPRIRRIRIVRYFSMYNRGEAPQYYPDHPDHPT
jgi:heme-degrading monooxygenase HmoA